MSSDGQNLKLAGVAGWPVHHSLSPLIHNYWIKQLAKTRPDFRAAYTMFAVRPDEAVKAFKSLEKTSITGLNITIPLKELAFKAVKNHTPDAQKLGVCNVIYKKNGQLTGHNTDMQGFSIPLFDKIGAAKLLNMSVCLIGTGGAARAALGALLSMGVPEIRLIGRDNKKAENLASYINMPNLHSWRWENRQEAINSCGLIINATCAGMKNNPPLAIDLAKTPQNTFIYDLVYTPRITPLLQQAKDFGLPVIEGIDMLIAQARPSFKLFFGYDAPKDNAIKDILLKRLSDM